MEPHPPHTCVVAVVIVCTMGAMDVYLVEQSAGARRLGVGALALAGDLFFLLALRYATAWVGGEARQAQRGYAMVLWFLFAFALEIKLYFIYQHYATEVRVPDPLARRTLTLLLSVCIPALYTVLGAAELVAQAAASFRKKDELRGRLFWVVLDLLDVLEIQASLWEPQGRVLPLWAEGLTFFYCYGLLLVLPCVSLNELGVCGPQPDTLYPLLSLASVNVATIFIRGGLLLLCRDQRISSIFMGKNVLAIALKCCAALQHHQRHKKGKPAHRQSPQLHRHIGTTGEACPRHVAPDRPQGCAGHIADDQPQVRSPPRHLREAEAHYHVQPVCHQLHSHCPVRAQSARHHGHAAPQSSPHDSAPGSSRALRTAQHIQLKSLWSAP
ncbi:transmembrane protein 121 [Anolis carolinensis]|uniref:transmembrane protein 121 n=1 Tax=Anolis carolinensis TaxID=28377 RepID=UPI002F2B2899